MSYTLSYKSMTRICGCGQYLSSHPYPAPHTFSSHNKAFCVCCWVTRHCQLPGSADKSLAVSHCCRGDLVGRTTFWMLFEWLAKVRATG